MTYAYHVAGVVYSFTPELRGNAFNPPSSEIEPAWRELWAALVAMIDQIELQQDGGGARDVSTTATTVADPDAEGQSSSATVSAVSYQHTLIVAGIAYVMSVFWTIRKHTVT